jgi:hypothetical protein
VHAREVVLLEQNIIVRLLACAEYFLMATQIKVPLDRAHDRIDDDARRTVRVAEWLSTFDNGGLGEKDKFVVFANDGERDGRVEVRLHGSICVGQV